MMDYNYKRFSPLNYDYGSFSGPKPGEEMLDFALRSLDGKGQSSLISGGSGLFWRQEV